MKETLNARLRNKIGPFQTILDIISIIENNRNSEDLQKAISLLIEMRPVLESTISFFKDANNEQDLMYK